MVDLETMVRTEVAIDGVSLVLAQDQDIDDLKHRIEAAAKTTGTFVDFMVVGNRAVSVLISSGSRVTISVATVRFDPRDTGDISAPFDGLFDF